MNGLASPFHTEVLPELLSSMGSAPSFLSNSLRIAFAVSTLREVFRLTVSTSLVFRRLLFEMKRSKSSRVDDAACWRMSTVVGCPPARSLSSFSRVCTYFLFDAAAGLLVSLVAFWAAKFFAVKGGRDPTTAVFPYLPAPRRGDATPAIGTSGRESGCSTPISDGKNGTLRDRKAK